MLRKKMFKKTNFNIFLICLALVQICLAKPANNEAQEKISLSNERCQHKKTFTALLFCEEDDRKPPSLQLFKFTILGLEGIFEITTVKAYPVIEQILSDQELLQIAHNDEVKAFMQKLQNAQEVCQNCRCFKRMERMLDLFLTECANYYKQEELDKLSSDGKEIVKVLKKYDVKKILDDYDTDVNKFIEKFNEKYENLNESINEENNNIGEKLKNWYEEFKAIKNCTMYGRKIKSFLKLFIIYREEFLENETTTT